MRTDMRLCLAALLVACDARPLVVVSVAPLPSEAAELYASLSYRGKPALSPSPLRFDLTGGGENEERNLESVRDHRSS